MIIRGIPLEAELRAVLLEWMCNYSGICMNYGQKFSEIYRSLNEQQIEETLNAMLDAEADQITQARKYERTEERQDTRAGHYNRKLLTTSGEVNLRC